MNKLIEGADFFVRYMNLPQKVWAFVSPNDDGTFSIYLDPRRSIEQQKQDYIHEVMHIYRNDFYNGRPMHEIEKP